MLQLLKHTNALICKLEDKIAKPLEIADFGDQQMEKHSYIMQRVREEIWPLHERIEKHSPLDVVAQGQASKEHYVLALKLLYGIIVPLENELKRCALSMVNKPKFSGFMESTQWGRSQLLECDLVVLGSSESEIACLPFCSQVPQCGTPEQALAILYLLQGSRLGGKVIASNVKSSLGYDERTGCAYFSSNGCEIGHYWIAFKEFAQTNVDKEHESIMIESVKIYLIVMETWFKDASAL